MGHLSSKLVDAVDHLELGGRHGDVDDAAGDHPLVVTVHEPHKLTPRETISKPLTHLSMYVSVSAYLSESPVSVTI